MLLLILFIKEYTRYVKNHFFQLNLTMYIVYLVYCYIYFLIVCFFQINLEHCIYYANILYTKIDKNEWCNKYSNFLLRDINSYIINTRSKLLLTFIL